MKETARFLKRYFGTFLFLLIPVWLSAASVGDTFTYTYNGVTLNYMITSTTDKTCQVGGYDERDWISNYGPALIDLEYVGPVTIPSSVEGYTVTAIGVSAFNYPGITSIDIPSSVITIGDGAFADCSSLCSISLLENVTSIGNSAFSGCTGLTSITIPNSVTSIGSAAFNYCTGLTSVTIPNSVTSIGSMAFSFCSNLKEIELSENLEYMWDAFNYCTSLTAIYIPKKVRSVGPFIGCNALRTIRVDEENLFYDSRDNCNAVILTRENKLVAGCPNTVIPQTVRSIGEMAFAEMEDLEEISVPESVIEIEYGAFAGTKWLEKQPNGIVYAGKVAYTYKYELDSNKKEIVYLKNGTKGIAEYAFNCAGVTAVIFPDGFQNICENAFYECDILDSIVLPASINYIDPAAFNGSDNIKKVVIKRKSPLPIQSEFNKKAILYVPFGCKAVYEEADVWKNFEEIAEIPIEFSTDDIEEIYPGNSATMTVRQGCIIAFTAYQMDLVLPDGITLTSVVKGDGKYIDNNHTLDFRQLSNGSYRIFCGSMNNDTIHSEQGILLKLTLSVADDCLGGNLNAKMKNIIFTDAEGQTFNLEDIDVAVRVTQIPVPYAIFDESTGTLTFKYDVKPENGTVFDVEYAANGLPTWLGDATGNGANIRKVVFESSFRGFLPTSTKSWFANCINLTQMSGFPNTSEVTDMSNMFYRCSSLSYPVHITTDKVTDMSNMFYGCSSLITPYTTAFGRTYYFNTQNVTNMHQMFYDCSSLVSLNFGDNSITDNVTNMEYMFSGCSSLQKLDLSKFNTKNVSSMRGMFYGCKNLTNLDLSHFVTTETTDMAYLFAECSSLTDLDLTHFDTENVTGIDINGMYEMFSGCRSLATLVLGKQFCSTGTPSMQGMFTNCTNLSKVFAASKEMAFGANVGWPENVTLYVPNSVRSSHLGYGITVSDSYGDMNVDNKYNVQDFVTLVKVVLDRDQTIQSYIQGDLNADGDINVLDVVQNIDNIFGEENPTRRKIPSHVAGGLNKLVLYENEDCYQLVLDNAEPMTAFQFELTLPKGVTLGKAVLNTSRSNGHQLTWSRRADDTYIILGYSMMKNAVLGNSGELLSLYLSESCEEAPLISNVHFVTVHGEDRRLEVSEGQTTVIKFANCLSEEPIIPTSYDLSGRKHKINIGKGVQVSAGKKILKK